MKIVLESYASKTVKEPSWKVLTFYDINFKEGSKPSLYVSNNYHQRGFSSNGITNSHIKTNHTSIVTSPTPERVWALQTNKL